MALENMTCPNCGATVEFTAGASTTTCKFCNSTLRLAPQVVSTAPSHEAVSLDDKIDPYRDLADMQQIKALLRNGQRQQAIRLYMEQTGASLKEAQTVIDGASFDLGVSVVPTPTGPYAIDLEKIQGLLVRGNKLEAIKVLRAQTNLGLKEAKDAVEVIERGGLPTITHDQRGMTPANRSGLAARFGCLIAILPILLSIGACIGVMGVAGQVMFRAWGPYDYAMTLVRNSAEVKEALGAPLNTGLFMFGGIESDDRSSDAGFETPIYGSKRNGSLRVSGSWDRKNGWNVSVWVYYDSDGEEQTIYLSGRQK